MFFFGFGLSAGSSSGWSGGEGIAIGASAAITRSGGKVAINSVPMRTLSLIHISEPTRPY